MSETEALFSILKQTADPVVVDAIKDLVDNGEDRALNRINLLDFSETEVSSVRFFSNGTCDELTLVLQSGEDFRKITLEFSTSVATAEALNK